MISWHEVVLRLAMAIVFCGLVGGERTFSGKAAGLRTHLLVGLGAAIFTIISAYAFHAGSSDRIAAQVVTGIGFIGGGAILKERGSIKGLTTAAGLWAAAALGMAAGAGLFVVGALGTASILLCLVLLHPAERLLPQRSQRTWIVEMALHPDAPIEGMRSLVTSNCSGVHLEELEASREQLRITFQAQLKPGTDLGELTQRLRAAGAEKVTWTAHGNAEMETTTW